MIRFWDFKLTGAPPLLSWVVRQAARGARTESGLLTWGHGDALIVLHRAGRRLWQPRPNQALQPTTGAGRFHRVQAHSAPAAAELGRSASENRSRVTVGCHSRGGVGSVVGVVAGWCCLPRVA